MKKPKFQIYTDTAGELRFQLNAATGDTIFVGSEGYATAQNCLNRIAAVKRNAPIGERYKRKKAASGQYYFFLIAASGDLLGISGMFDTLVARENGIKVLKRDAPTATVEALS